MALACLKFVNRQRPDVRCFVDFAAARNLPSLIPEAFEASDVYYAPGKPAGEPTWATRDSLVYRKWPPVSYIESMLVHLNDQTGLGLEFEPGVYPSWHAKREPRDYVVLISQGKRRARQLKEWGCDNFQALATLLTRAGYDVVQIGARIDMPLRDVSRHVLGQKFVDVLQVLARARGFIGIENGMMVLAGFLGVPQITIYDGDKGVMARAPRCVFPHQVQLVGRTEPDEALAAAMLLFAGYPVPC